MKMKGLEKTMEIRKEILEIDKEAAEFLKNSKTYQLENTYQDVISFHEEGATDINKQYKGYNSILKILKDTKAGIIKHGNKHKDEKSERDLKYIWKQENKLNELFEAPIKNTINYTSYYDNLLSYMETNTRELAVHTEETFEKYNFIGEITESIKELVNIKKFLNTDPKKSLELFVNFVPKDRKRMENLKSCTKEIYRDFYNKKRSARGNKETVENKKKRTFDSFESAYKGSENINETIREKAADYRLKYKIYNRASALKKRFSDFGKYLGKKMESKTKSKN